MNVFLISLESRIRTILKFVRSKSLTAKKEQLAIKYVNSLTARQISSIQIYLVNEASAAERFESLVNLPTCNPSLDHEYLERESDLEEAIEEIDEREAVYEFSFINHDLDESDEDLALDEYDNSVMMETSLSYIDAIENKIIELVELD